MGSAGRTAAIAEICDTSSLNWTPADSLDEHAAMCLRLATEHPGTGAARTRIVIDLRDLTAVDARAVGLLDAATADCRAREDCLTLLLRHGAAHRAIADVFAAAGFAVERADHAAPISPQAPRAPRLPVGWRPGWRAG